MKPIYKTVTSVLIVLMLVSTTNGEMPFIIDEMPAWSYSQKDFYTSVCCIGNNYLTQYSALFEEIYVQIPVKVEVWDKNLNPKQNIKVYSALYHWDNVSMYWKRLAQNTKYTNNVGIVRNGYSIRSPIDTTEDYVIYVTAYNNTKVIYDKPNYFSIQRWPIK